MLQHRLSRLGVAVFCAAIGSFLIAQSVWADAFIGGGPSQGFATKRVVGQHLLGGQNETARVTLAGRAVEDGGPLSLDLDIQDVRDLQEFSFVFRYDPERYTLVSSNSSDENILSGEGASFSSTSRIAGEVVVKASTAKGAGAGEGALARFTLQPKEGMNVTLADFDIADGVLIDIEGRVDPISAVELLDLASTPMAYGLDQNFPNPFNPITAIAYQLPENAHVSLVVYNVLGQQVRTLVDERVDAGEYTLAWDGRDEFGRSLASGIYLYRIRAGDFSQVRKMLFLK